MKSNKKILYLILSLVLIVGLATGCGVSNSEETLEIKSFLGQLEEIKEDTLSFNSEENKIDLFLKDDNIKNKLDQLDLDSTYLVSYDQNKNIVFLEKQNLETTEPTGENKDVFLIPKTDKEDFSKYTLVNEFETEIKEGLKGSVKSYTSAQKNDSGEIMWDDGHEWILTVQLEDGEYILFKDYIQLGELKFHVYTVDQDNFHVFVTTTSTANLTVFDYKYNSSDETFNRSTPFTTDGNVNLIYSSNGY